MQSLEQAAYFWFKARWLGKFPVDHGYLYVNPKSLEYDGLYCGRGPAIHLMIPIAGSTQMMPLNRK